MNVWLFALGILAALCIIPVWKFSVEEFQRPLSLGSLIITMIGCYAVTGALILSAFLISSAF